MEPRQLEALVAIAASKTMRAAAELLGVSPPALTKLVQRLEGELQLKLAETSPLRLTEAGRRLLPYAQAATEALARAEAAADALRLGNKPTLLLNVEHAVEDVGRRLTEALQESAFLGGRVTGSSSSEAIAAVASGLSHAAVLAVAPDEWSGEIVPLRQEQAWALVAQDHPLTRRARKLVTVRLSELERFPVLIPSPKDDLLLPAQVERFLRLHDAHPPVAARLGQQTTVQQISFTDGWTLVTRRVWGRAGEPELAVPIRDGEVVTAVLAFPRDPAPEAALALRTVRRLAHSL